jgi:hypothetical protein
MLERFKVIISSQVSPETETETETKTETNGYN